MKYVKMLATKQNKLTIHMLLLIITFFIKKEKYILKIFCFSLVRKMVFMNFIRLLRFLPTKEKEQIEKVIDTLRIGGRSEKTITNYVFAILRFLKYFKDKDISKLKENDIIEYIKNNYLNNNCAGNTYNMNICAIKYFYSINFNKDFNNKLLPRTKLIKKLPSTLDKEMFIKILNEENNLRHKCWLLLAYCSGLRTEEVASVRIKDINTKEHKLKVLGKRKKERFTLLPDITIKYLRLYYRHQYLRIFDEKTNKTGYLFEGNQGAKHISSSTVTNYFTAIKKKYNLDENISFHSLRHSFASNFIKAGGDLFVLKSMLGHTSLNTTSIYIHMGRDFNNLKGVKYE